MVFEGQQSEDPDRVSRTNFLENSRVMFKNSNIYRCYFFLSFLFLLILSYDNKQERAVMSDAAEILKSVQIGLNVVIFLLNTDRGLRATELCNECVILLQNLNSGSHLDISDVLFNAYYAISGYTDAERHATKLLDTFNHAWRLIIELGDKYSTKPVCRGKATPSMRTHHRENNWSQKKRGNG